MSTFTGLTPGATEFGEMVERAQRAAKRAKVKHTSWQNYVRMLTRNPKLKLAFTSGTPCTDGETIWLRVPIKLGDDIAHDRMVCGERDPETMIMACPACRTFDDVDCTKYHEVGHIVSESFTTMPEIEQASLVATAIKLEAKGLPASKRAVKLARRIESEKPRTFVHASACVSPWLKVLLNATEDARVNAAIIAARPGVRSMFQASACDVFANGVELPDGSVKLWRDAELNMQAVIGVYLSISQLPFDSWLHPDVVTALHDEQIADLCFRGRTARSVSSMFRLSIQLLERLRVLGFCLAEDDEEDDEPDPGEGDPSDDESDEKEESDEKGEGSGSGAKPDESEPDEGEGTDGDQPDEDEADDEDDEDSDGSGSGEADAEVDADTDGADDAEGTDDGADDDEGSADDDLKNAEWVDAGADDHEPKRTPVRPAMGTPEDAERGLQIFGGHNDDGSVDDKMTDDEAEEVDRAIQQGDFFDAPSRNIRGVSEFTDGESGEAWGRDSYGYGRDSKGAINIPETVLGPALLRMRRVFQDNRKGAYQHDRKSGRIDATRVARRLVADDPRWFKKKVEPGKKDYFVLIGLDVSGSTGRPGVLRLTKEAGFAQQELLNRMGVKSAVYAHTGENDDLAIYVIKSPDQPWDAKAKARLTGLNPASANLDGHTLEYYRKVLDRQTETDKLIMYYTDGAMPCENFREELQILQREIEVCKRSRYGLVGVGIRNDDPKNHGLDTIRIDGLQDIPKLIEGLKDRIIHA